ncbi:MAG: type II toxin-antitoxin system VapC family toxin [Deltaproteobacteria bacterium]|nr:type II toxin-antitoxin system VapC family toxin [Deltaproteobacteria bacterium]
MLFRQQRTTVIELLRNVEKIAVNTVVLGELLAGFKGGIREVANRKELDQFLDSPRVEMLPLDESSAEYFAMIFNGLKQVGKPIPTNDIWIAASAMQHGRTLATLDSHFSYIAGLSLHPALERIQP